MDDIPKLFVLCASHRNHVIRGLMKIKYTIVEIMNQNKMYNSFLEVGFGSLDAKLTCNWQQVFKKYHIELDNRTTSVYVHNVHKSVDIFQKME